MTQRVLIIEDNDDSREVYGRVLSHAGYDVMEASDGVSGLVAAEEFRPALVLLDVGLPGMTGWDVCASLKSRPDTEEILVLFISGFGGPEDLRKARDACGDGYITKPAEPRRILEEVRALIGRP